MFQRRGALFPTCHMACQVSLNHGLIVRGKGGATRVVAAFPWLFLLDKVCFCPSEKVPQLGEELGWKGVDIGE